MGTSEHRPDWREDLAAAGKAAGPSVRSEIAIAAPAAAIWAGLAEPGYLKRSHPFCAETEVERWPGVGARDSITYYSGRRYQRRFVAWVEGEGYDIELGEPPHQTARVLWRIGPETDGACPFSIEVVPLLPADMAPAKRDAVLAREFGADLQHYLDCVVQGVKHWIETGEDVGEDRFGWNPLYSRPGAQA